MKVLKVFIKSIAQYLTWNQKKGFVSSMQPMFVYLIVNEEHRLENLEPESEPKLKYWSKYNKTIDCEITFIINT
jgi:hypothetical protein